MSRRLPCIRTVYMPFDLGCETNTLNGVPLQEKMEDNIPTIGIIEENETIIVPANLFNK
jgi:hypothetical protein